MHPLEMISIESLFCPISYKSNEKRKNGREVVLQLNFSNLYEFSEHFLAKYGKFTVFRRFFFIDFSVI